METNLAPHPMALQDWREQLRQSLSSVEALVDAGWISGAVADRIPSDIRKTVIRVPPYYLSLIGSGPLDPIRLQCIPTPEESDPPLPPAFQRLSSQIFGRETPWLSDPIGDQAHLAAPRLTHRYGNRALLHVSSACSMYCRFCFRKSHLSSKEPDLYNGDFEPALRYLQAHPEVRELILTGGDPLSLTDASLLSLFLRLETVASLQVVRIHTRMPATLPYRLTLKLLSELGRPRSFKVMLVTHFNHPRELTPVARHTLERCVSLGIPLYNQAVLLSQINDDATILSELFQKLYELGAHPYYLHHPDYTPATSRFRVPIEKGRQLIDEVREQVSGPALPDYILDVPGGWGKISLTDRRVNLIEARTLSGWHAETYEIPVSYNGKNTGDQKMPTRYLNLSPQKK